MPLSWWGPDCEIWTPKPFQLPGMTREQLMRGVGYLRGIGRLKPGITIEQAKAALTVLQADYRAHNPEIFDSSWTVTAVPIAEDVTGNLRPAFITLLVRGRRRLDHRVQQCREFIARSFYGAPP